MRLADLLRAGLRAGTDPADQAAASSVREKPLTLAVPTQTNQTWPIDFMHDQLAGGRSIRL